MSHSLREKDPLAAEPRKGLFGGLVEGIRNRRDRSAAADLIDNAMALGRPEDLQAAMEKFTTIDKGSREKLLLRMQARLESTTSFPFESETKVRIITVAGEFFSIAGRDLERDGQGNLIMPYGRAISIFKYVLHDNNLYDTKNPSHPEAKLACAKALWELEAGGPQFWEERIFDQATSDFTIRNLLSLESAEKGAEGWPLLRKHLPKIALMLAVCQSERKADFFTSMLLDQDPQVLRAALAGSLYLEKIPPEFFDIARDISQLGSGLDFDSFVFVEAAHLKALLTFADERQFDGARGLISLYRQGAGHLGPLLHFVGREMVEVLVEPAGANESEKQAQQAAAGETLALLAIAGIRVPGVQIDIQKEG